MKKRLIICFALIWFIILSIDGYSRLLRSNIDHSLLFWQRLYYQRLEKSDGNKIKHFNLAKDLNEIADIYNPKNLGKPGKILFAKRKKHRYVITFGDGGNAILNYYTNGDSFSFHFNMFDNTIIILVYALISTVLAYLILVRKKKKIGDRHLTNEQEQGNQC